MANSNLLQINESKLLMTAQEVSKTFFAGKRSPWSLLQDAKKKAIPCCKIGNRVFFEKNALNNFFDAQLMASTIKAETTEINGIRKID